MRLELQTELSDTEKKIFTASLAVFAEYGKEGARMQDIADRAGITKALVHYYFRSKDRLFEKVFEYIFRTYLSQIGEAVAEAPDFRTSLKRFIDTYIDLVAANPVIFNFMFHQLASPGST